MIKVIYASRGGHTKKIADAIARTVEVQAEPVNSQMKLENVDLLFVGSALYAGKLDAGISRFLQELKPGSVKRIAVFSTSMAGTDIRALVQESISALGITVEQESFQCPGTFLFFHRNRPNAQDEAKAVTFAKRMAQS